MIELKVDIWDEIQSEIDKDDIYNKLDVNNPYGLQERPHLTLLYPIKKDYPYDIIKDRLDNFKDKRLIDINIIGIDMFESQNYDILIFKVDKNEYISKLEAYLKGFIPNYTKISDFNPHITIGYLKKGKAIKYCRDLNISINYLDTIVYATRNGDYKYKLDILNEAKSFRILRFNEYKNLK
jgi:2'-5' RNA ligase